MMEEYTTTQQSYDYSYKEKKNTNTSILFSNLSGTRLPLSLLLKPKISEKAKEFIESYKISVDAFRNFIAIITTIEGVITDVNIDLFEYYEEGAEEPLRSLSIAVCIKGVSTEEKVDIVFKLNKLLYIALPDFPSHFIYKCPNS